MNMLFEGLKRKVPWLCAEQRSGYDESRWASCDGFTSPDCTSGGFNPCEHHPMSTGLKPLALLERPKDENLQDTLDEWGEERLG